MGIFYKEYGGVTAAGYIAGIALVFSGIAGLNGCYVNKKKEVHLEIQFGDVTNVVTEPGVQWKTPFITTKEGYSLTRQTISLDETLTLRTSDDVRLTNPYGIEFEISAGNDGTDEISTEDIQKLKKLYFDLDGSDVDDIVILRAQDAAVQVYEAYNVTDLAEEGFTQKTNDAIKKRLQEMLDEQGWPIRILAVTSKGFTLTEDSEKVLERIIDIRQEKIRLELREENAQKAKEVFKIEAESHVAYIEELKKTGLLNEHIVTALQLKMASDIGRVMEPFGDAIDGNLPPGNIYTPK